MYDDMFHDLRASSKTKNKWKKQNKTKQNKQTKYKVWVARSSLRHVIVNISSCNWGDLNCGE